MRPFEGRFFFARQPGRRRARAEQAGRWHRLQRSIDPVFRSMTPDRRAALMRDMPIDFAWGGAGLADLHGRCDVFVVLDVLCFTTSVDVAVARGADVLPFPLGSSEERRGGKACVSTCRSLVAPPL